MSASHSRFEGVGMPFVDVLLERIDSCEHLFYRLIFLVFG